MRHPVLEDVILGPDLRHILRAGRVSRLFVLSVCVCYLFCVCSVYVVDIDCGYIDVVFAYVVPDVELTGRGDPGRIIKQADTSKRVSRTAG